MHQLIDRQLLSPTAPQTSASSVRESAQNAASFVRSRHTKRSASSSPVVSILIVDEDAQFCHGVRTLINFWTDKGNYSFAIVGEATSRNQAMQLIEQHPPTIVLLDVGVLELGLTSERDRKGLYLLSKLQSQPQPPKVLMMSDHQEDDIVFKCMQAGAFGYVSKNQLATQLHDAIATILNNQIYLAPHSITAFFRIFHFHAGRSLQVSHSIHLSPREYEVLSFLVEGSSNETIAKALYISVATVKAHLTSIFEKLEVKSRTQAIVRALKLGLV